MSCCEASTWLAGGAIPEGSLVKINGTTANSVIVCDASGVPIGVAKCAAASGEFVTVVPLVNGCSYELIASEAITQNEAVYTAASGKVQDKTTATLFLLGIAKNTSSADGDRIWVTYLPNAAASVTT